MVLTILRPLLSWSPQRTPCMSCPDVSPGVGCTSAGPQRVLGDSIISCVSPVWLLVCSQVVVLTGGNGVLYKPLLSLHFDYWRIIFTETDRVKR